MRAKEKRGVVVAGADVPSTTEPRPGGVDRFVMFNKLYVVRPVFAD